ncbi:MAG: ParB N-terminal domain-containing protein, partial [Thermoplasmata archaeon]|nr:ParB N-terminal domain-containing protein [Thermoplasmata archaeon]
RLSHAARSSSSESGFGGLLRGLIDEFPFQCNRARTSFERRLVRGENLLRHYNLTFLRGERVVGSAEGRGEGRSFYPTRPRATSSRERTEDGVGPPNFQLIPIARLHIHEEVIAKDLEQLIASLRASRIVREPILVAADSWVVLNGHHRVAALRALGARAAPAWVVDYADPKISLDRWDHGPPLTKAEVIERARSGRPFPPKTTRHRVLLDLPERPTSLTELGVPRDAHDAASRTEPLR